MKTVNLFAVGVVILTQAVQQMWLHFPTYPSLYIDKECLSNKECAVFETIVLAERSR